MMLTKALDLSARRKAPVKLPLEPRAPRHLRPKQVSVSRPTDARACSVSFGQLRTRRRLCPGELCANCGSAATSDPFRAASWFFLTGIGHAREQPLGAEHVRIDLFRQLEGAWRIFSVDQLPPRALVFGVVKLGFRSIRRAKHDDQLDALEVLLLQLLENPPNVVAAAGKSVQRGKLRVAINPVQGRQGLGTGAAIGARTKIAGHVQYDRFIVSAPRVFHRGMVVQRSLLVLLGISLLVWIVRGIAAQDQHPGRARLRGRSPTAPIFPSSALCFTPRLLRFRPEATTASRRRSSGECGISRGHAVPRGTGGQFGSAATSYHSALCITAISNRDGPFPRAIPPGRTYVHP